MESSLGKASPILQRARENGIGALSQKERDRLFAVLENDLSVAVADFGVDELAQMLKAADAIRKARRHD